MQAKTFDQVCSLQTDHKDLKNFWMLTDSQHITIANQKTGEKCKQSIDMPKVDFDRFVVWYTRQQKLRSRL